MKPFALFAAAGMAVIGAVAWGLLFFVASFEIGYLAWGIGAAIGFFSFALGGHGNASGLICATLALVSIATGKVLGSIWTTEPDLTSYYTEEWLSEDRYRSAMDEAIAFVKLKSEKEYPEFMVEYGCTEAADPAEVTKEDIEAFKEDHAVELRTLAEDKPTIEQWREKNLPWIEEEAQIAAEEEAALWTVPDHFLWVVENSTGVDIIFVVLGFASAFALGRGRNEEAV